MSQEHKTAALVFALLNFYDSVKLKKSKAVFDADGLARDFLKKLF